MGTILLKAAKTKIIKDKSMTECKLYKPSYNLLAAAAFFVINENDVRYRVAQFEWDSQANEPSLPAILLQVLESPKTVRSSKQLYGHIHISGPTEEYFSLFSKHQYHVDIFPLNQGYSLNFEKRVLRKKN
jgi:hypothetical protein